METTVKIANWSRLGIGITMLQRHNELTKIGQLYDITKSFVGNLEDFNFNYLPIKIEIPVSMDLVKELSYFAPTVHNKDLDNNLIKFTW